MRKTLKIVLPTIVSVAAVSLLFVTDQLQTGKRMLRNDLSHSAKILGESLQESIEPLFDRILNQFYLSDNGSVKQEKYHFTSPVTRLTRS
jgi:hypothetical protein